VQSACIWMEALLELGDHLGAPSFVTQLRGAQAGPCALGTARRLVRRLLAPRLLRPVQRVLRLALKRCGMGGMVEARPFNGRLAGRVERVTVHRLERGAARLWGGEGAVVSTCMLATVSSVAQLGWCAASSRGHQWSSGAISGHQGSSVRLAWCAASSRYCRNRASRSASS
jgi:hypothetical protein